MLEAQVGKSQSKASLGKKKETLSVKKKSKKQERAGGVTQVVELFPS
jgi:hypothetical protein